MKKGDKKSFPTNYYSNETYVSVPDYGELILNIKVMANNFMNTNVFPSRLRGTNLKLDGGFYLSLRRRLCIVSVPDYGELILNYPTSSVPSHSFL